jgi:hypothetical protein
MNSHPSSPDLDPDQPSANLDETLYQNPASISNLDQTAYQNSAPEPLDETLYQNLSSNADVDSSAPETRASETSQPDHTLSQDSSLDSNLDKTTAQGLPTIENSVPLSSLIPSELPPEQPSYPIYAAQPEITPNLELWKGILIGLSIGLFLGFLLGFSIDKAITNYFQVQDTDNSNSSGN